MNVLVICSVACISIADVSSEHFVLTKSMCVYSYSDVACSFGTTHMDFPIKMGLVPYYELLHHKAQVFSREAEDNQTNYCTFLGMPF